MVTHTCICCKCCSFFIHWPVKCYFIFAQTENKWNHRVLNVFTTIRKGSIICNNNSKSMFYKQKQIATQVDRTHNNALHEKWSFPLRITSENMQYSGVKLQNTACFLMLILKGKLHFHSLQWRFFQCLWLFCDIFLQIFSGTKVLTHVCAQFPSKQFLWEHFTLVVSKSPKRNTFQVDRKYSTNNIQIKTLFCWTLHKGIHDIHHVIFLSSRRARWIHCIAFLRIGCGEIQCNVFILPSVNTKISRDEYHEFVCLEISIWPFHAATVKRSHSKQISLNYVWKFDHEIRCEILFSITQRENTTEYGPAYSK